jgi:hypothetical protein
LPGIQSAHFESKTPAIVGSRIKVQNTDGSSHTEEIITWDVNNKVQLRFQEFNSPLKHLASHFIETWSFSKSNDRLNVTRSMVIYPKGMLGWLMLIPIARLMKKAFEKNSSQINNN